jgi:aminoglycoside 6'-N-acetyltransferase
MTISIRKFTIDDIPLFLSWSQQPHIKEIWFLPGYLSAEKYVETYLSGDLKDMFPYLALMEGLPMAYVQYCDIDLYLKIEPKPKVFTNEPSNSYSIDMFIGDPTYMNKGWGSKILVGFVEYLHAEFGVTRFLIDPSVRNIRAIKCYQKAGFQIIREDFDDVEKIYVMEKIVATKPV